MCITAGSGDLWVAGSGGVALQQRRYLAEIAGISIALKIVLVQPVWLEPGPLAAVTGRYGVPWIRRGSSLEFGQSITGRSASRRSSR